MSSSGNASGVTRTYVRDAQDVTLELKRKLVRRDFTVGVPINTIPNGNASYIDFLFGRISCGTCISGSPFQMRDVRLFR
jgi:hypothetical protein